MGYFPNNDLWLGSIHMPIIGSFLLMFGVSLLSVVAEKAAVFTQQDSEEMNNAIGLVLLMLLLGGLLYGWFMPEFINTYILHYYDYENWAVKTSKVVCSGLGAYAAVRGAHLWISLCLLGAMLWGIYHLVGWIFS